MEAALLRSYRLEFAKRAEWRREDERRTLDQVRQKEEQQKREEREREAEHEALIDMAVMTLATTAEIADFNVKLDTYDAATVEALMENEQALEKVREEMRVMLDKAYVLPDGRKVFKTEDGTKVFDERGQEVTGVDPDQIEDWRPRHEQFEEIAAQDAALSEQRRELIEYQDRLDEAREAANADGVTKAELDDLERRLEDAPAAVKAKLAQDGAGHEIQPANTPQADASFRPAGKLDMPVL